MPQTKLDASAIRNALSELHGWTLAPGGDAIEKTYRFDSYRSVIRFVNAVADVAERHGHHPDLGVHYGRVVVRYSTHDAGGITPLDLDAARAVDALTAC